MPILLLYILFKSKEKQKAFSSFLVEFESFHNDSVYPPNFLSFFVKTIIKVRSISEHFFLNIFPYAPCSEALKIKLYFIFSLYNEYK